MTNISKTKKNYNFLGMLSRMKYINRWGLMRNTITENIAEHSLDVAVIAHALAVIGNVYFNRDYDVEHIVMVAIYHDTSEIITGDMPTPIKYYAPDIKNAYKDVERIATDKLLSELPEEMRDYYKDILHMDLDDKSKKIVKAADKISALVKCMEEISMGNHDFDSARESLTRFLAKMELDEVTFFMEKFLPSYDMTLDEQSNE